MKMVKRALGGDRRHAIVSMKELPHGTWVPVSVAAYLRGQRERYLRKMVVSGDVKSLRFPVGPLLVRLEDVPDLTKK